MEPKVYNYKKLDYQGKTVFRKMVMGSFDRIEKYFQENEACFMFVDNGSMVLRTPYNTIEICDGEGLFAKCGNYFFEKQNSDQISLMAAYFYPEIVQQIFTENIFSSTYNPPYDAKRVVIDELLLNFKQNLSLLLDHPEIVDEHLLLTKLKEFILLLAKSENAPGVIDFVSSFFKPFEYEFKMIIENNKYADLSLDDLAKLCGMSLATFKRNFSEYYQTSPKQYLIAEKIKKASKLLLVPGNRISDIAYDCGFDTVSSFNRNFKKLMLQSPSEYREKSV